MMTQIRLLAKRGSSVPRWLREADKKRGNVLHLLDDRRADDGRDVVARHVVGHDVGEVVGGRARVRAERDADYLARRPDDRLREHRRRNQMTRHLAELPADIGHEHEKQCTESRDEEGVDDQNREAAPPAAPLHPVDLRGERQSDGDGDEERWDQRPECVDQPESGGDGKQVEDDGE